jgi:hypothetical protein
MFLSPLRFHHPISIHPRRIVPHMLLMTTLQLRHPILPFVQMKSNNLPPNPNSLFFHVVLIPCSAASGTSARTNLQGWYYLRASRKPTRVAGKLNRGEQG